MVRETVEGFGGRWFVDPLQFVWKHTLLWLIKEVERFLARQLLLLTPYEPLIMSRRLQCQRKVEPSRERLLRHIIITLHEVVPEWELPKNRQCHQRTP
jgi:hypothetical protein